MGRSRQLPVRNWTAEFSDRYYPLVLELRLRQVPIDRGPTALSLTFNRPAVVLASATNAGNDEIEFVA